LPLPPTTASLGAFSDVNRDSDMPAPAEHTLSHWLHPRQMLSHLRDIDTEAKQERQQCSDETLWLRAWTVIAVACLCLLMVHYLKYSNNLREFIPLLESLFGIENSQWKMAWLRSPYRDLIGNIWWGCWQLIGFMLIPMLTIRFILKQRLRDYGWQLGSVREHWLGYVLLATPIMVFAIIASFGDDFSNHYPFYKLANRSWSDLLMWEAIYILQFVAVEFFFRGFLVNGLRLQFGSLSVAVMCLPYLMLHFPKLWPESFGAILFGFFLGILAVRSKSIWGGVAVHVSIALTMDIAALLQTRGLPQQWSF
jgi:membrane protease YdiL (CAAX protease family)